MSAGWTPGPWQRKTDYPHRPDCVTIVANVDGDLPDGPFTYDFIATCEDEFGEYTERAEANARLIAAAPELYEAVQTLLAAADHAGGLGGCDPELEAACRVGSAALAKARGHS